MTNLIYFECDLGKFTAEEVPGLPPVIVLEIPVSDGSTFRVVGFDDEDLLKMASHALRSGNLAIEDNKLFDWEQARLLHMSTEQAQAKSYLAKWRTI